MERRRVERIAWAISGSSFLAAAGIFGAYLLGWRPETALAGFLALVLLLVWLLGMLTAITYSEDGWTLTGTNVEWAVAFALNPVLAAIMFSNRGESPEEKGIDLEDHERLSKL